MRTRHPGVRTAAVAVLVATALGTAACSGSTEIADVTVVAPSGPAVVSDPTPDASPSTTGDAAPPTPEPPSDSTEPTEPSPTTTATSGGPSTSSVDGLTGPAFSDALGVRVDTAPGVRTRGDTRRLLDAGLYVHLAWEADPDDPSVFTVQPDDIPILEAYANASLAYYRAATTTRTTEHPDFAKYFTDSGAKFEVSFQQARDGGFVLSLGTGVVLRPYIPADQRSATSAIVLDCYLQNQQFFLPSEGAPAPAELTTSPTIASMVLVDGQWKIESSASEPAACL
ncbi:MAG: hypothetical protein F2534_23455 [Actinobacteria bacterium]|uniref:Unannotated protein n=1 Tax=freshwater metagenome TaxID=449393 RepID=A0A6J6GZT3_9ZZZZ|nr:hypothetical protein [Actinomycetota bacterium]